ncbi:MAG: hypothetical protein KJP07_06510 [Desulfatitalea sp.]|nr:hypothetical protein [Desulfatitalea sp.]
MLHKKDGQKAPGVCRIKSSSAANPMFILILFIIGGSGCAKTTEIYEPVPIKTHLELSQEYSERNAREKEALLGCQRNNTPDCYKDYLKKHPYSGYRRKANQALSELEFREFDRHMRQKHSFDLLLYRLQLKRLSRRLFSSTKMVFGDFSSSAAFDWVDQNKYFRTVLIFKNESVKEKFDSGEISEETVFDEILKPALLYLKKTFKKRKAIHGFSFEVAFSDSGLMQERITMVEFFFPLEQVDLYIEKSINKGALFAKSMVGFYHMPTLPRLAEATEDTSSGVLKWRYKVDGVAKNGRFARETFPELTFEYPTFLSATEDLGHHYVFNARGPYGAAIRVQIIRLKNKRVAGSDFMDDYLNLWMQTFQDIGRQEAQLLFNRPISDFEHLGLPVFEFCLKWICKRKNISFRNSKSGARTYGRVFFREDHAIVLSGEAMHSIALHRNVGMGDYRFDVHDSGGIDYLKFSFNTLDISPQWATIYEIQMDE